MKVHRVETLDPAFRPADVPRPRAPEAVFVGRSNVGKSSLINYLLGRKGLARVSKTPGKTRGAFFYAVNGEKLIVVDLHPGLYFGTSERLWLGLQADYELAETRRAVGRRIDREVNPRAA